MKSYLKQDNVARPAHNFILVELNFNVKFPLLRPLHFLSDLKSTILSGNHGVETINRHDNSPTQL